MVIPDWESAPFWPLLCERKGCFRNFANGLPPYRLADGKGYMQIYIHNVADGPL